MKNFGKAEKIIFTVALCALGVFSYFLYDDSLLFPKSNTSGLEQIGSFVVSKNDVRRKNSDTFSWIPASNSTLVFQKDSIFTGSSSTASIQLSDGTVINVEPNSLITLNLKNGQMTLDLKYGDLQAEIAANSNLTVKTGAEETKLESTSQNEKSKVRMKKAFSGLNVNLESGNAAITAKGTRKNLDPNAKLKVANNGDIKPIEKPQTAILTENMKRWLKPNPEQPIPVQWQTQGAVSGYEVELSLDPEFKDLLVTEKTKEPQFAFSKTDQEANYYWRVKTYDTTGNLSSTSTTQQFAVELFKAPQITSPLHNSLTNLEVKPNLDKSVTAPVQLTWSAMPQLEKFEYQISQSSDFSELIQSKEVVGMKEAIINGIASGKYFARVKGFSDQFKVATEWSEAVQFELQLSAKKEPRPAAPILAQKKIEFIPLPESERTPASPAAPVLAWKPISTTKAFKLQIAKDKSFKDAAFIDTTSTQFSWDEFSKGTTYYRVFAIAPNGLISPPSETGEIIVGFKEPILAQLKRFELRGQNPSDPAPPQTLPVRWSSVPTAKNYRLEMATSADFANPIVTEVAATESTYVLETPGKYYFRVKALDQKNQELTGYSNPQETLFSWKSPLGIPSLREPFDKASIFLQKEMEAFIWLEWKKVEGAKAYTLEISTSSDFSKPFIRASISSNRYLIKDRIPLGKLYWRVRANAENNSEDSEWTKGREFTVHSQKNETFVK